MATTSPKLLRSAPYFLVRDLSAALAHYQSVLGFEPEYVGGAPPIFAIVSRDGLSIMLRVVTGHAVCPSEQRGGTWDAFLWVEGLDALAAEYKARNADFVYGPTEQAEYQMREFAVRDPEGHVLGFGEPVGEASAGGHKD